MMNSRRSTGRPQRKAAPLVTGPMAVILMATLLDALGIGLIFPVLPALLQSLTGATDTARAMGWMVTLYAALQVLCAPLLGALSDRFGRRPVLLLSLAGSTINYLFLAEAHSLWLLLLGRALAGLTGATQSVATACITDTTPPALRPRRFGLLQAMFGAGFILGPVVGGALGEQGARLPFLAAAALNAVNLALAFLLLPETRQAAERPASAAARHRLRPLQPWRAGLARKDLWPLIALAFLLSASGEAYGVCWVLWGQDALRWNGLWIGLSLGAFGICQTVAQALVPGPAVQALGERATLLLGSACACGALTVLAFATQGWMVFASMPLFALGGIGGPALQALAARQVDDAEQGQFQGVLSSAVSLASVLCPLGFAALYTALRADWPGEIWLSVLLVHLAAAGVVMRLRVDAVNPPGARVAESNLRP